MANNLTWIHCSWDPSNSLSVEYYLVELIPLIYDSISGMDSPRPELKITAKTERDLSSGNIPTAFTFHNLQPNVKYQVRAAAVDRFNNISPILSAEVISGGSFPALTASDITLNSLLVHLNGVYVSWNVNSAISDRIMKFQVFTDTQSFTDLTSDRLKYEGLGTTCQIPANSMLYIKLRAIDLIGRPAPILSDSIDATPTTSSSGTTA
ncbi:MAG: fibronectin type III domain-containing protein [Fidelibacterota bacterium]